MMNPEKELNVRYNQDTDARDPLEAILCPFNIGCKKGVFISWFTLLYLLVLWVPFSLPRLSSEYRNVA
jgi:hypothetical protein